jgi:hypothetical protein
VQLLPEPEFVVNYKIKSASRYIFEARVMYESEFEELKNRNNITIIHVRLLQ